MAALLNGSAPSPYAVSVGKAIIPPDRTSESISSYAVLPNVSVRYTFTRGLYYGRMQYNAPTMEIGKHNPKLIEIRKAIRQGSLTSDGLLPIEGSILLEEAQRSGIDVVDIFYRKGTELPAVHRASIFEVNPDVFATIQDTEHSQGLIATVRPPQYGLADVLRASPQLVLILSRLQDPGNVGTILRIGESFGSTGCIALRGTAGFYNSKVVRASAGSIFRFPHTGPAGLAETVTALRSRNLALIATSPRASQTIEEWDWRTPTAIFVGNEGQGLSSEELDQCDTVLCIPQKDAVDSLNSAIATAVILYEASKQRR
jgi:RNA methyltransferase, TrmH family